MAGPISFANSPTDTRRAALSRGLGRESVEMPRERRPSHHDEPEVVQLSKAPDELIEDRVMNRRGFEKTVAAGTAGALTANGLFSKTVNAGEIEKIPLKPAPKDGSNYHPLEVLEYSDLKPGMNKEDWIRLGINHGFFDVRLADHGSEQRRKFDIAFARLEEKFFPSFVATLSRLTRLEDISHDMAREIPLLNSGKVSYAVIAALRGHVDETGKEHFGLDKTKVDFYLDLLRSIPPLDKMGIKDRQVLEDARYEEIHDLKKEYKSYLASLADNS